MIRSVRVVPRHLRLHRFLSNNVAESRSHKDTSNQQVVRAANQDVVINTRHALPKKDNREPFAKGFFLGRIDTELMAFPEVIAPDQLADVEANVRRLREIVAARPNTANDDQYLSQLKQLKVFGSNIPQHLHGSGYFETESQCIVDCLATDYPTSALLNNHRVVADLLNQYGNDEQKNRFLPAMATGEKLATIAIFEDHNEDLGTFATTATLNVDEQSWKIHGKKPHVVQANRANCLLVGVQVEYRDYSGDLKDGLAFFFIDKDTNGVTVSEDSTVSFDNVVVPAENMLGTFEKLTEIGMKILARSRLYSAQLATGVMRKLLQSNAVDDVKRKLGDALVSEKALYQERSGRICSEIFAVESALYFTLGLLDGYKSPDIELECALIKSYASRQGLKAALETLNSSRRGKAIVDDAIDLQNNGESLDSLRQYIGLLGCQYAGMQIHETVKKGRNPMHNPMSVIGKIFRGQKMDEPKPVVHLQHFVHPSFDTAAKMIEKSIIRQQLAVEVLLTVFGKLVVDHDSLVLRLAELCELNFMMICTLMRASRSYCIGLKHCEYDMFIANSFIHDKFFEAERLAFSLANSDLPQIESQWARAGRKMYELGGYYQEHPTARNF